MEGGIGWAVYLRMHKLRRHHPAEEGEVPADPAARRAQRQRHAEALLAAAAASRLIRPIEERPRFIRRKKWFTVPNFALFGYDQASFGSHLRTFG